MKNWKNYYNYCIIVNKYFFQYQLNNLKSPRWNKRYKCFVWSINMFCTNMYIVKLQIIVYLVLYVRKIVAARSKSFPRRWRSSQSASQSKYKGFVLIKVDTRQRRLQIVSRSRISACITARTQGNLRHPLPLVGLEAHLELQKGRRRILPFLKAASIFFRMCMCVCQLI